MRGGKGIRNSKFEMRPYYAPNPLRGGASKGIRGGVRPQVDSPADVLGGMG